MRRISLWAMTRRRHPDGVPEAVWRRGIRWRIAARVLFFACYGLVSIMLLSLILAPNWITNWPAYAKFGIVAFFLSSSQLPSYFFRRWTADFDGFLINHDFCVCEICAFPLTGLPTQHTCPECGTPFDVDELRRRWRAWWKDRALQTRFSVEGDE